VVKRDRRPDAVPTIAARSDQGSRSYRVLKRKKGQACDVEMTEASGESRLVIAFDTEAEAWDWVDEQQTVNKSAANHARNTRDRESASLASDDLTRLGELAVAELERRGYDVRGKSAEQIKKILRFPPPKIKGRPGAPPI
jgi:hypothetical protein